MHWRLASAKLNPSRGEFPWVQRQTRSKAPPTKHRQGQAGHRRSRRFRPLQGEGVIQEVKGKGQKAVGDVKQATKDAVNNAAGAANKNL